MVETTPNNSQQFLMLSFPKDASVADNLVLLGGSNQWNMSFSREAHDWKVDVFVSFSQVLHSVNVRRGSEDKLWWVSSKKACSRSGLSLALWLALWEVTFLGSVWQTQAPTQAAYFGWSAVLGKILALNNLRKRYVILVDRCCMCKRNGESVDHLLLLHCDVAYAL